VPARRTPGPPGASTSPADSVRASRAGRSGPDRAPPGACWPPRLPPLFSSATPGRWPTASCGWRSSTSPRATPRAGGRRPTTSACTWPASGWGAWSCASPVTRRTNGSRGTWATSSCRRRAAARTRPARCGCSGRWRPRTGSTRCGSCASRATEPRAACASGWARPSWTWCGCPRGSAGPAVPAALPAGPRRVGGPAGVSQSSAAPGVAALPASSPPSSTSSAPVV
jgi:hypothetical protein